MIEIALYQPDIPQNTGTILRLGACFGLRVHIIEPAGFALTDRNLKRAGMDYLELASLTRHRSWETFEAWRQAENRRLLLLTTKASVPYADFSFANGDVLLFGRESCGVPDTVHAVADHRLTIPMQADARSLNLAVSAGIVSSEALRQLSAFPKTAM